MGNNLFYEDVHFSADRTFADVSNYHLSVSGKISKRRKRIKGAYDEAEYGSALEEIGYDLR